LMVATAVVLLIHAPPEPVELSVVVAPTHADCTPVITVGTGLTVIVAVAYAPELTLYVMVTVPAATPVTMPEREPTVAISVLALTHDVPPGVASVSNVVPPVHTVSVPLIGAAAALTVILFVLEHPEPMA
jgi:hypothetical protein